MNVYTAKEITEILDKEGAEINLRTVRYYTQIGLLPPLELFGNKRVYTETHITYLRAILTLSKTGESLSNVQKTLEKLTLEEVENISEQFSLYQANRIIEQEVHKLNDDVFVAFNRSISPELRSKVVNTVNDILKGHTRND